MKSIFYITCLLVLAYNAPAQEKSKSDIALNQVIEDFRTSIIDRNDFGKFSRLFLHDSITWASINVGKTKAESLKTNPDFKFYSSDFSAFYKLIKSKDGQTEEKFYNVEISEREEFATISFDYSFNINDKILNWGTEYWSLILVDDGWKITSVTWTSNLPSYDQCPFKEENQFVITTKSNLK